MTTPNFLKSFFRSHTKTALALHEDALRYIELEGDLTDLKISKKVSVPSGGKCIEKNSLTAPGELLVPLQKLAEKIGGFQTPVALGIPSRDILIRVIELPELGLNDAREALRWNFDEFFPYSFSDAAVDIAKVENPLEEGDGNMSVLVAACKLRTIDSLLRLAMSVGMKLTTIEPENVAMFRAGLGPATSFAEGYLVIFAENGVTQLILGYKDNGILYRTSLVKVIKPEEREYDFSLLVREIDNTITFVRNQYRGLHLKHIMLGGSLAADTALSGILQETTGIDVLMIDPWRAWNISISSGEKESAGWEAAVGLAVRELS